VDDFQRVSPEVRLEDLFHRDGCLDEWGEWLPGNTWKSERVVQESADWNLRVKLVVSVLGHRSNRRCWPRWWRACVEVGQRSQEVASGRCKSLRDAARQTKDLDAAPHVRELLRAFYGQQKAVPVYRQGGATAIERVAHDGWVPWASTFGDAWPNSDQWPGGKYLVVGRDHAYYIDVRGWRASGGDEESRRLFKLLPRWCGR
jgi:hypothetical protein